MVTKKRKTIKHYKQCKTCFKLFPPDEIEAHIKVHSTELHMNNHGHPPMADHDDTKDEKLYRAKHELRVYKDILSSQSLIIQQLLELEKF